MRTSTSCFAAVLALAGASLATAATAADRTEATAAGDPVARPEACVYFALPSGVVQTASVTPEDFSYTAINQYWSAVGIRSAPGDDWDLHLYDTQAADPVCVSGLLAASSGTTGVDIVVGDYNHSPLTQEWARAHRFSGTQAAAIEHDAGFDQAYLNGPSVVRTTDANDVLEAWDIYLPAGAVCTFNFSQAGSSDCKLLLFRNPASSTYFAGRSARVFETNTSAAYTAPASDFYGVVVVNDNGGSGSYAFSVSTCAPAIALASGAVTATFLPNTAFSFNQTAAYWTAIGVRQPLADWDIVTYGGTSPGPAPSCFSAQLGGSGLVGPVDFVVGDFNVNPAGTYYANAYPYSGNQTNADVEWDSGLNLLYVNGAFTTRSTGPGDVLEVWDAYLVGGIQYTLDFYPGSASNKLLVFENPGSSPYWTGRGGAVVETASATTYTPTFTGYHGIAVVNDDGASGSYSLRIGTCSPPSPLTSATATSVGGGVGYYSFNQVSGYWTAVGVRGASGSDWDLDTWTTGSGSPWSACFDNQLAGSSGVGIADFVIGDFNHNSLGNYYVRPYLFSGNPNATLEWDDGTEAISVNGPLINRITGSNDVLEVWDVFLAGGVSYDVFFEHHGAANVSLLMFQSASGTYWAPRSASVLTTTSLFTSFTAPATDWYGVVVVNDNGAAGHYKVGIATNISDAGNSPTPEVTALRQVGPNPTTGAVQIDFDLHAPASVGLQVVDVAGRLVSDLPRRDWTAGHWSATWNGTDAAGRRAAAGVYYVRMLAAGREVGRQKFLVLH